MTAPSAYDALTGNQVAIWSLILVVPLLLAADLSQRSNALTHLPEPDSYRSNLSGQALKSSAWRKTTSKVPDWRAPSSPQIEWRTDALTEALQPTERHNLELYPQYSPGGSSTFDLSTREDQSGYKVFEFDFGR